MQLKDWTEYLTEFCLDVLIEYSNFEVLDQICALHGKWKRFKILIELFTQQKFQSSLRVNRKEKTSWLM